MKLNFFKSILLIVPLLSFQCHAAGLLVPATKAVEMQNRNYNIDISKNATVDSMVINVSKDTLSTAEDNEKNFSTMGQAQEYIRLLKKDGMYPPKGILPQRIPVRQTVLLYTREQEMTNVLFPVP